MKMSTESHEKAAEHIEKLERIVDSMKTFLFDYFQALGPDPLANIREIVKYVGKTFHSAAALYNRLDEEDGLLKTWAIDEAPPNFEYVDKPDGHVCYMMTIRQREPNDLKAVAIENLDETPFKELDANVRNYNLKAYLAYPVALHDKVVGSLCVVFGAYRSFSAIDEHVLEAFAKGIALEEERKYSIELTQKQMLLIKDLKRKAESERDLNNKLLLNILPEDVAEELKEKGVAPPVHFKSVSILFTDFVGFTSVAEKMTPQEVVASLDQCFGIFDKITEKHHLEKLKTIGDSYMCAGGLPRATKTHPVDVVLAAIEMRAAMAKVKREAKESGKVFWDLRIGIHTGPLVAGVVGEKKFAYDVWGDTVNLARRMESGGAVGEINISRATHDYVREFFDCQPRGLVPAKNRGEVEMFFVKGIKRELLDGDEPNEFFVEKHKYYKV